MADRAETGELVSVDSTIDAIAREALAEARRIEESQRYRQNPGPVGPPRSGPQNTIERLFDECG